METERTREVEAIKLALADASGEELTPEQRKELAWLKFKWFSAQARALPKKHYCDIAETHRMICNRQANSWGIPLDNSVINVGDVLKAFHDFVAKNSDFLTRARSSSDAHEHKKAMEAKMIEMKIKNAEIEFLNNSGKLIDRDLVRDCFTWLATEFKAMAEDVGRQHGAKPQETINNFLLRLQKEISNGKLAV